MSSTVSKRRLHGALKPDKTGYSDEPNVEPKHGSRCYGNRNSFVC